MYEPEVEVKKIKKELEKIQKECDDFKNEIAVSSLMKTVNDFQATFSKSLDEIQKNLNALPARGISCAQLKTEVTSNSFEALQTDLIILSTRVSDTNKTLSEIKEILRRLNEDNKVLRTNENNLVKETVLLLGGDDGEMNLDSLLILQDNGKNWEKLAIKLPYAISNHGAQFLNNHLYIFGGENMKGEKLNFTYKLSKTLQWEKIANMHEKRWRISSSSVILNDRIWVLGGSNREELKSVEMYNPITKKWKLMREMNECRKDAAAVTTNGKIFCYGGWSEQWRRLDSAEYYDPSYDVWTLICDMPRPNAGLSAVELSGNLIVLDTMDKHFEWIDKLCMPLPRIHFSIARIDDKIFVCGGESEEDIVDDVEIFDGEVWSHGPRLIAPRGSAAATVIPMDFAKYLK